jgi:glycogen phosphorylase
VLNLSTIDGWWDEAYTPEVGWAIGQGEVYSDGDYQDRIEAEALYNLLERDVVPMFYDRVGRVPRRWIEQMKANIASLCYFFNTNRMVAEYTERFYMPLVDRYRRLSDGDFVRARSLAAWRRRTQNSWSQIRVESVDGDLPTELRVGQSFRATARVYLGNLKPEDVRVELYVGLVNASGDLVAGEAVPMHMAVPLDENSYRYEAETKRRMSGQHGYTVRVLPHHPDLVTLFQTGMVRWAG